MRKNKLDAAFVRRFWWLYAVLIGLLIFKCTQLFAATSSEDTTTVQLKRGTTIVTLMPAPTTLAECEQRKAGLIAIDAQTKFSGTSTYSCIETRRSVVTFSPNSIPAPVDCVVSEWGGWEQGTPSACLGGSQTRTDTRTRTVLTQPANGGLACPVLTETQTVTLACTVPPPPTETWTQCATEPNMCAFSGTRRVRYGLDPTWIYADKTGGTPCTNTAFGSDPVPGKRKQCWLSDGGTVTPPPPPPPPPPPATGSATIGWTPPTQNSDGSALTNLAGFRVLYGTAPGALTQTVNVPNAAASSYLVEGLASGTWYFAAVAYTSGGAESVQSNVASKVIP